MFKLLLVSWCSHHAHQACEVAFGMKKLSTHCFGIVNFIFFGNQQQMLPKMKHFLNSVATAQISIWPIMSCQIDLNVKQNPAQFIFLNIDWFSRTSIITKFCENAAFFKTKFRAMHDAPRYKIKYSRAIKSTTYCRKMSKNTVQQFLAIIDYLLLQSNLIWLTYSRRKLI